MLFPFSNIENRFFFYLRILKNFQMKKKTLRKIQLGVCVIHVIIEYIVDILIDLANKNYDLLREIVSFIYYLSRFLQSSKFVEALCLLVLFSTDDSLKVLMEIGEFYEWMEPVNSILQIWCFHSFIRREKIGVKMLNVCIYLNNVNFINYTKEIDLKKNICSP